MPRAAGSNTARSVGPQLTLRAAVLGIVLAALLAAANTYLGLFAGLTIASAIPSAVVSMAVLKMLGGGSILENNIVQTGGSAGSSTATGVIFTAPALVMLGFWNNYPYGWIFAFAALGGVLGVLFTVPLRRALIIEQKLRFPEGVAAAEVLKAGDDPARGAKLLAWTALGGAALKLLAANGLRLIPDSAAAAGYFFGKNLLYLGTNLSGAILGVGYICGMNAGVVMIAGSLIAWDIALPIYTHFLLAGNADLSQAVAGADAVTTAGTIWSRQIRYIGVGTMVIGGLWTIYSIRGAMVSSVRAAIDAARRMAGGAAIDHTEQDLPLKYMLIGVALCTVPLFFLYHSVVGSYLLSIPMTIAMIILAFVFSAVSAYLTGLVGGSNDPVSGMIIATILAGSALLLALNAGAAAGPVAAVMIGAAVCCALCLASDNLQDLKCGHIVGATPWRQQLMLAIGALTSAVVLAPVLNLLARAYGIGVATPEHPDPLIAPQAVLIGSVSKALFGGSLPWNMVITGVLLGVVVILVDEWLKRGNSGYRAPVLAVAVGVYLPLDVMAPIFLGGLLSYFVNRRNRSGGGESLASRGMLFAAGMIAGESLMGVIIAFPIVLSGKADILALPAALQLGGWQGQWLGLALLGGLGWLLYRTATRRTATRSRAGT